MSCAKEARPHRAQDLRYFALLVFLILLVHAPNLLLRRPVLDTPLVADLGDLFHPAKIFLRQSYPSGHFPLWNPHDLCGMPFLAFSHTGSLYPLGMIYLLPFPLANSLSVLIHLLLAGALAYLFFRSLDLDPPVAFILSLSFSLSGMLFRNLNFIPAFNSQVWMPLFFLAIHRLASEFKLKWLLLFSLGYGLCFLGGDHETLIYTSALAVWFALAEAGRNSAKVLVLLVAGTLLALLLVSAQFLPLLEFLSQSLRGQKIFNPVNNLPLPLIPVALAAAVLMLSFQNLVPASIYGPLATIPLYLGLLTFLGFLAGVCGRSSRLSRRLAWFMLLLLAYALVFTRPSLRVLIEHLPLLNKLLSINAILTPLELCALLIAGQGIQDFLDHKHPRLWRAAPYFFPAAGMLILASCLKPGLARPVWLVFGLALVSYPLWSRKFSPASALVLLSVLDVSGLAAVYLPRQSYQAYEIHPQMADLLLNTELQGRYLALAPGMGIDRAIPFSAGIKLHADSVDSLIRAPIYRYARLASLVFPQIFAWQNGKISAYYQTRFRNLEQITADKLPFLDLLNLRWVISREPAEVFEESGRYRVLAEQPLHIYENRNPLPRAVFFRDAVFAKDDETAFQLVKSRAFNFHTQILVSPEKAPKPLPQAQPLPVDSISRPCSDRLHIIFRADSAGYLFVAENFFPGWRAFLDRKETRIFKADYAFRAIYAGPGEHVVEFVYQPWSFRLGLWASLATLACTLLALATAFTSLRASREEHPKMSN